MIMRRKDKDTGLKLRGNPDDYWDSGYWRIENPGGVLLRCPPPATKKTIWADRVSVLILSLITIAITAAFIIFLIEFLDHNDLALIMPLVFFGGLTAFFFVLWIFVLRSLSARAADPQPDFPANPSMQKQKPRPIQHRKDYR
jgi:hypothetical protein